MSLGDILVSELAIASEATDPVKETTFVHVRASDDVSLLQEDSVREIHPLLLIVALFHRYDLSCGTSILICAIDLEIARTIAMIISCQLLHAMQSQL